MEPLYYVMAILGCADGGDVCQVARTASAHYTSFQACQLAMDDQLLLNSDLSYPTIAARCRPSRPQMVATTPHDRG